MCRPRGSGRTQTLNKMITLSVSWEKRQVRLHTLDHRRRLSCCDCMNIYEVAVEMRWEIICSLTIATLALRLRLTQTGNWKSSPLVAGASQHIVEFAKHPSPISR